MTCNGSWVAIRLSHTLSKKQNFTQGSDEMAFKGALLHFAGELQAFSFLILLIAIQYLCRSWETKDELFLFV